ncbi:hypothetical protein JCM10207_002445 [Rhodosporidiobolus poonsookiae]
MPPSASSLTGSPRLPLELQLEILRLSSRPTLFDDYDERLAHLGALSLVHSSWTRAARAPLFDKLDFDLRYSEDDEESVGERWAARMDGLRRLAFQTNRLVLFVDGTSRPTQSPALMPWSVEVVEQYTDVLASKSTLTTRSG